MKSLMFLRGKFKGLFFVLRAHVFFPSHYLLFFSQLSKLSRWISKHKKEGYSDFYSLKFQYDKREFLFNYVIEKNYHVHNDILKNLLTQLKHLLIKISKIVCYL